MRIACGGFAMALVLTLAACSEGGDARKSPLVFEPKRPTAIPTPPKDVVLQPTVVSPPLRPAPPATAGKAADLVGTRWTAGEYTFIFQPGGNVLVRGGHFDEIAPGGAPGRVQVRDGVIEMNVLGRMNYGTWNGSVLTITRQVAVRIEE